MIRAIRHYLGTTVRAARRLTGVLKVRARRWLAFLALFLVLLHWALLVGVALTCLLYNYVNPPLTGLMLYRQFVSRFRNQSVRFIPLESIPAYARRMFVQVEDHNFYRHHGIDLQAIRDAYRINRRLGYVYYGGSTISQQLARTLFLAPTRTYLRKYLETLIALEMEIFLPKKRILELYVNYIEYGEGIYGIAAASRYHYGKAADRLSRDEYRRLVTIVASPLRYDVRDFTARRALQERYDYLCAAFP
jgi:monofunctional biosynthetic peptidoglycan transglycosylase